MHAPIGGVGVIYPDTSFVDNRDMDKINPILQKIPDTVDGSALILIQDQIYPVQSQVLDTPEVKVSQTKGSHRVFQAGLGIGESIADEY